MSRSSLSTRSRCPNGSGRCQETRKSCGLESVLTHPRVYIHMGLPRHACCAIGLRHTHANHFMRVIKELIKHATIDPKRRHFRQRGPRRERPDAPLGRSRAPIRLKSAMKSSIPEPRGRWSRQGGQPKLAVDLRTPHCVSHAEGSWMHQHKAVLPSRTLRNGDGCLASSMRTASLFKPVSVLSQPS